MKLFFRIFLALISVLVFLVRSPLYATTPIEIVNNLGVATPLTQFGVDPFTGLPASIPPHLDLARSAVRILGSAPVSKIVSIDVQPRSDANRLDPDSRREINVAILSLDGFNALTVDPNTVRFGATGNEASPVHVARRDVDGNGQRDIVLRFEIQDTEIECGDTSATLSGQTSNGESILGSSPINTVHCYTFTTIDFPGADSTSASKINAREQIVGGWFELNKSHGVIMVVGHGFLLEHGVFITIDEPASSGTTVSGINSGMIRSFSPSFSSSNYKAKKRFVFFLILERTENSKSSGLVIRLRRNI